MLNLNGIDQMLLKHRSLKTDLKEMGRKSYAEKNPLYYMFDDRKKGKAGKRPSPNMRKRRVKKPPKASDRRF